ncbi:hypothetical protein LXL04_024581 [Taraxacum kok-saghyz]
MVGVNSSYSTAQNDVVFVLRVSKCRRFTVYPHSVVFPSRRLHPPVHVYQSNGSYFMFSLLLMSSSRYIFYSIVSLPIFSLPLFPFQTSAMLPFCCAGFFLKIFTGLLLKASGTLCTGLRLYAFLYAYPICVEKSMKLSGVSFPGISLEDSLSIGFFLKILGIFYLCSGSFRFSSTGLLLKLSGFLCTAFLKMQCFFCYFFNPSVFSIYVLLISVLFHRSVAETIWLSLYAYRDHEPFGCFFSGIVRGSLERILFSFDKGKISFFFLLLLFFLFSFLLAKLYITFVAEHETDILNGLPMVSVLPHSDERVFYVASAFIFCCLALQIGGSDGRVFYVASVFVFCYLALQIGYFFHVWNKVASARARVAIDQLLFRIWSSSNVFFTLYIAFYCLASYLFSTFVSFSNLRYTPVLLYIAHQISQPDDVRLSVYW